MAANTVRQHRSTDIKLHPPRHHFTWRLENFTLICPQGTNSFHEIKAPNFSTRTSNNIIFEWDVTIEGSGGMMYCTITQKSWDWENDQRKLLGFGCTVQTFLGNMDNPSCYEAGVRTFKFPSKLENSRHSMVSINNLYERREILLRENTLYFYLHAQLISPEGVKTPLFFQQQDDERMHKLSTDFQGLLDSTKNWDVEIKCGTTSFKCHKLILAARSKVFSTIFEKDSSRRFNELTIDDMRPSSVYALLKYIYTGNVDPPTEFGCWATLIHGAEKYELKELKDYCFNKMFEHVTDDNVGWLAVAAHTHNAHDDIKKSIKSYCKTNIAQLLEVPSFRELFSKHIDAFY